ncbi:SMC-Scp complex subunit ScpB [Methyloprofundus sp.]|uniref:SMC-Scp complex subunit ScpB n=1 Tax=Methyloprofundus sp. TaxID=2020875 RepID=UPI003D0F86AC
MPDIVEQQVLTEKALPVDSLPEPAPKPKPKVSPEKKARPRKSAQQEKMAELVAKVAYLQAELDAVSTLPNVQSDQEVLLEQSEQELEPAAEQTALPDKQELVSEQPIEQGAEESVAEQLSVQESIESIPEQPSVEGPMDLAPEQISHTLSAPVAENSKVKRIVEALLFAAEQPMTIKQLHAVFPELEAPEKQQIQESVDSLSYDYRDQGIGLHKVASGYRFQVKTDMAPWVARLFAEKPPKYSRALLETIAIIAYQQPVTRGDIEEIRGVSVSSYMIRTLLDREWIKVLAHKEVPGRPALYGTTKGFLDYFNLPSLDSMPPLEELQALALEGEMEI